MVEHKTGQAERALGLKGDYLSQQTVLLAKSKLASPHEELNHFQAMRSF